MTAAVISLAAYRASRQAQRTFAAPYIIAVSCCRCGWRGAIRSMRPQLTSAFTCDVCLYPEPGAV